MKIYTFRCSNKPDLFAVSQEPNGNNLPKNICTGEWVQHGETEVEPGDAIAGFVSRDLFRDLERQGFHLASGVGVTVSSFAVDGHTASVLTQLQKAFGVTSNAEVIRKALALANVARQHAGPDNTITISSEGGKPPVKVFLDQ